MAMAEIMLDDWYMADLERCGVEGALAAGWEKVTSVTAGLGDAEMMLPSRCAGWVVADVLYHLLLDAQMALVTFASPGTAPPDADDISTGGRGHLAAANLRHWEVRARPGTPDTSAWRRPPPTHPVI